jgi:hypothetical protein
LRVALANKDISGKLHAERNESKRWRLWKNADALKTNQRVARPVRKRPDQSLQSFLNTGALVARLPDRTLLFNLAGIKPRSVFQEDPDPQQEQARQDERDAGIGDGSVELPEGIGQLLITTPWGAVYQVTADDLNSVVSPIPMDQRKPTARVLAPLIQGRVPMANIPEERDDVIGDGCMCYVINLSSFSEDKAGGALEKQLHLCEP